MKRQRSWASLASLGLSIPVLASLPAAAVAAPPGDAPASGGAIYYVSGKGSDNNSGLSKHDPLRNIQAASDRTNPGDTVLVMDGTYADTSANGVVRITRSGEPSAWITYKAAPGAKPVLKPKTGWDGVSIYGASYIKVEGLEVEGDRKNMTLEEAQASQASPTGKTNPTYNVSCMTIRADLAAKRYPHHIVVKDNYIHDCPSGGIISLESDYLTIEENTVHSNSWYGVYATSGIAVNRPKDAPGNPEKYKIKVLNNRVFDNEAKVKWTACDCISDGNGIIIDSTATLNYTGRTLVANNVSYDNGGSGIHAFKGVGVDIFHNTVYANSRSTGFKYPYPNIGAQFSTDVKVMNNISYASPGKPVNYARNTAAVEYDYNIYFGGTGFNGQAADIMGPHDVIADPKFINPANGDFRVLPFSPAVDTGLDAASIPYDFLGVSRPQGAHVDRGAFERHGAGATK